MYTKAEWEERRKVKSHLSVEIPRPQHERLKEVAKQRNVKVSELVRKVIGDYLKELEE